MEFGQQLKEIRKEKGMSQVQLAKLTGHAKDEMLHIGLITMGLMERCFMNGFEFEACLSMAINQVNKE